MSVKQGDGGPQDGQVFPIEYDEKNMPRTVSAHSFVMIVLRANQLKTQIIQLCGKMVEHIEEIEELEESQEAEISVQYDKRWAELEEQFHRVEVWKKEHEDLVCKIKLMCNFMLTQRGEGTSNLHNDAKEKILDIEKAELEVERVVKKFRKDNKDYVRGKKKKKTSQAIDSQENSQVIIDNEWILQICSRLDPEGNLKNNSELTEWRSWKRQWIQYTTYLKKEKFPLDKKLYAQMLIARCDASMKMRLEAMEDIYEVGEEVLWERIENIYLETNPLFLRRVKCYENRATTGEMLSEFATRLKIQYRESEMADTTAWGHLEYKLLTDLDTATQDSRELKAKLVKVLEKIPNPDEKELDEFLQVIKDHEAIIKARDHHIGGVEREDIYRVETVTPVVDMSFHKPCGKKHEKNQCELKCTACGKKGHRTEVCYRLHPEKAPAHWTKSPSKKPRGRSRERGRSRSNSRDNSRNKNRSSIERKMSSLSEDQRKKVVELAQQTQIAKAILKEEEEKTVRKIQ